MCILPIATVPKWGDSRSSATVISSSAGRVCSYVEPNPRGHLPLIGDCRDGVRNGQFTQARPGRSPSSAGRSGWGVPITSFPYAPEACVA